MARPLPTPSFVPAHESTKWGTKSFVHPPLPSRPAPSQIAGPRTAPKWQPPKDVCSWRSKTCLS
eukprot:scaffold127314_cov31-Tisochrysis_lutea.AAC.1